MLGDATFSSVRIEIDAQLSLGVVPFIPPRSAEQPQFPVSADSDFMYARRISRHGERRAGGVFGIVESRPVHAVGCSGRVARERGFHFDFDQTRRIRNRAGKPNPSPAGIERVVGGAPSVGKVNGGEGTAGRRAVDLRHGLRAMADANAEGQGDDRPSPFRLLRVWRIPKAVCGRSRELQQTVLPDGRFGDTVRGPSPHFRIWIRPGIFGKPLEKHRGHWQPPGVERARLADFGVDSTYDRFAVGIYDRAIGFRRPAGEYVTVQ